MNTNTVNLILKEVKKKNCKFKKSRYVYEKYQNSFAHYKKLKTRLTASLLFSQG